MGIIESSYENLNTEQLLPSFFEWLMSSALGLKEKGLFGIGLIVIVALVSFMTFKGFRYDKAMIVSSMITFMVALLSLKAGWISMQIFVLSCVYVGIAIYYLFDRSSQEEV